MVSELGAHHLSNKAAKTTLVSYTTEIMEQRTLKKT
jgi:hypothetical protein